MFASRTANLRKSQGLWNCAKKLFFSRTAVSPQADEHHWDMKDDIEVLDPEMAQLIRNEKIRQKRCLELIASENFAGKAVLQALGSCMNNKYSEGQVGNRYYCGNEFIDEMETLTKQRCLDVFELSPDKWGVNVQVYSGVPANFAVFTALVGPHGRIMGLDLPHGGHLSHGFKTGQKKVSATSLYFEAMPYQLNPKTDLIDYDKLEETARLFKPDMIVAGVSCYSRHLDYKRFRQIADQVGAYVLADMAHVGGLVSAGMAPSPFEYCDVVTSTTNKTLRGPRSGIIYYRKGVRSETKKGQKIMYDLEKRIDEAVFPGLQGGPHNHSIAAIGVGMKQALTPAFKAYQRQVVANAKVMANAMQDLGYTIVSGGTDNHMMLIDLRPLGLEGSKVDIVLEEMSIAVNKNTCPGDKSAMRPGGIRLGTASITSRCLKEQDVEKVVGYVHQGISIAKDILASSGPNLQDYKEKMNSPEVRDKLAALKAEVEEFALQFPHPGLDDY